MTADAVVVTELQRGTREGWGVNEGGVGVGSDKVVNSKSKEASRNAADLLVYWWCV